MQLPTNKGIINRLQHYKCKYDKGQEYDTDDQTRDRKTLSLFHFMVTVTDSDAGKNERNNQTNQRKIIRENKRYQRKNETRDTHTAV